MRRRLPRTVLVRAPNWIGDAVMCEPAVRGLRSLFPQAELTMLAKPAIAEQLIDLPGRQVRYFLIPVQYRRKMLAGVVVHGVSKKGRYFLVVGWANVEKTRRSMGMKERFGQVKI